MRERPFRNRLLALGILGSAALVGLILGAARTQVVTRESSYRNSVPPEPFETTMQKDIADKPRVMQRQMNLLQARYDLSNRPAQGVTMSRGKPIQEGVRVKLPKGVTWEQLASLAPDQIREKNLFPPGFLPLPHVKQTTGGQVFPPKQINEIRRLEARSLVRFDVDFDLPDHFLPEFPPPIYLTTHPELGDVSQGKLLSIKNFFGIMNGIMTPVQIEGLRLLLTPFPQEEFNMTDDRKSADASLGVACFDCHANGHTNAAFHLNPDTRPQAARFRIDTPSLRGVFNQQIHGSKRSLRSVEDFSEFEQRTAYFNGDQVSAQKKGPHLPFRTDLVVCMAQFQNMLDFPPAPKLNVFGTLDPRKATKEELAGQKVFFGKGRCGECHPAERDYLDDRMHDLKIERFYTNVTINDQYVHPDGPMKTFTLRGIKDSPPYFHDGRLLTLEDTVEFFNLVLELKLNADEKKALVAFMRQL